MDEQLILFVRTVVVPRYWEAPNGRGARHLNDVLESARCLVGRELDDREYLMIALHDIGVGRVGFTRDEHPRAALVALDEDSALLPIRSEVDDEMGLAILLHMKKEYDESGLVSPLHQLLVEADEGCPVWGPSRIEKPVKYWLSGRNKRFSPDCPKGEVVPDILARLRQKVDTFKSGVAPYTERFCSVFADEISQASAWAMEVGEGDVLECIERLSPGHP